MPEDFHFLNPEWFLALVPLGVLLWGMRSPDSGQSAWQRVVDGHLLPHLLTQGAGKARWLPLALLGAGWIMGVLALANPTFERLPTPVYRGQDARVVILDLSRSMETPDLKPSRLARARYKVADILERSRDGQTGLVAFAGDAFVVAPLSDDADTVLGLLDAVTPEIMPVQGSRPDLALHKAAELLAQAGAARGEVILVGDDAGDARAIEAARDLLDAGHELSIIGVGTEDGRPIPGVRDAEGHAVVAALDSARLIELAAAGGGAYAPLSADESDLDRVLRAPTSSLQQAAESPDRETDAWRELGPWIALALLPLGALAFRRGWLLGLVLVVSNAALVPEPAMALSWDDLWQRRDQQAADALERGDHGRALSLAEQPDQRGTASYRLGDYAAAAEAYARLDTADAHYNRGNALAKAGSPEEALAAYDQALSRQPGMEDAAYNKARIEEWLKQQQEQQQQSQDGQQSADRSQDSEGGEQSDDKAAEAEQHAENQSQAGQDDQPEEQGEKDGESADSDAGQDGRSAQEQQEAGEDPRQPARADEPGEKSEAEPERQAGGEPDSDQAPSADGRSDGQEGDQAEAEDREATEQAAADYRQEAAEHANAAEPEEPVAPLDDLTPEQREARQAADQWLRRIPDDPAGLLRRKFLYQYRLRAAQTGATTSGDPW